MKGGTRSENQQDPLTCSRDPHPTLGNLHTIPLVSALAQGGLCSMPGLETPPPQEVSLKSFPLAGLQFLHQS